MDELKPRLRGVSHMLAFLAALGACLQMAQAPVQGVQYAANLTFGFSMVLMFGVSGTYHWPTWAPQTYQRLGKLDHAAIYILIAGSFTPLATLDLAGGWSRQSLWVMWVAALTGAALTLLGISTSRGLRSALYTALGLVSTPVMLRLSGVIGPTRVGWLVFEGVLYAVGAVVYARRWPDPKPAFFGYHELFHVMVIAAAGIHYVILLDVLGR